MPPKVLPSRHSRKGSAARRLYNAKLAAARRTKRLAVRRAKLLPSLSRSLAQANAREAKLTTRDLARCQSQVTNLRAEGQEWKDQASTLCVLYCVMV